MAVAVIYGQCLFLISNKLLKPINNKKNAVIKIRKAPNCIGVNPIKAFLIKINELPQTTESRIKKIHLSFFESNFKKLNAKVV